MQQLQLIGNIGNDATLKEHNGKKFVAFPIACNSSYKDSNGNKVEQTQWYDITTKAETLIPYLKKGKKVFVQGSQRIKVYENNEGQSVAGISVSARDIQLLSPKEDAKPESDSSGVGDVPF